LVASLLIAATTSVRAQNSSASAAPASTDAPVISIQDVPRATQMGTGPVPAGAPGNGRYIPPEPANPNLPTLWLIGDSTVRNGTLGDGSNLQQWGWGAPLVPFFDPAKINVVNRAFGGTSSRSFYHGFFWKNLLPQIKKGDFVLLQFGANDNGPPTGKSALKGVGDNTQDVNGETVHSFGWYLEQFVNDTRAQGATPIIVSLTPRKRWGADGRLLRDTATHAGWAAQAAAEVKAPYVDLNEIIARKYDELGKEKVALLYVPSPKESLHTGWDGAVVNAECVIAGLKGLPDDPLANYLSPLSHAIAPVDTTKP
jgi:lysophospholipase L1-like esterase